MVFKDDMVRLQHMLEYAQKAVQFTRGRSRADFDTDEMLALATIHLIETIGEAAKAISETIRERYAEIPWDLIIGTRNRLAHGYIDVDLDIIWAIVTTDLPPLIAQLEHIVKQEGHDVDA
ncbi:MAG: DUF86 domain-containing protein [Chloroflexi bacterium]|nr:DUF86 domain-containing protein [Chloroflexota bacterium]MBM3175185.1 DUF86 domain-containing protein [Chloroflexota bacterium]